MSSLAHLHLVAARKFLLQETLELVWVHVSVADDLGNRFGRLRLALRSTLAFRISRRIPIGLHATF
jgi:hypothetical protein